MNIEFTKMVGCGNDFIVIDNRRQQIPDSDKPGLAQKVCNRNDPLGADGIIFVEESNKADMRMDFYNSDGSSGEMCGNGLRCFARYVWENEIGPEMMLVETDAGSYVAQTAGDGQVRVIMPPVRLPKRIIIPDLPPMDFINVGVPHVIVYSSVAWDWSQQQLEDQSRIIRNHSFFVHGTNVNFVRLTDAGLLQIRTFERGVEGETLACGTGATAAALVTSLKHPQCTSPIKVQAKGGILEVGFQRSRDGFIDVWLQGEALVVTRGNIN